MKIKALILLCICMLVYLLSSCSAERRIARIAKNHNITAIRTKTVRDTVVRPEFVASYALPLYGGVFAHHSVADGLDLAGLVHGDTIYIQVRQPADTIVVTKEVPVEVVRVADNQMPLVVKFGILAVIALGLSFVLLIYKVLKR